MSFDLHLEHFQHGDSCPADRAAMHDILKKHHRNSPDPYGFYVIEFSNQSHVEFSARGLADLEEKFTGCGFLLRDFSRPIVTFVFDMAVAGDMVIFNAQGNNTPSNPVVILTHERQRMHLPTLDGYIVSLCSSEDQLAQLLAPGFDDWAAYRDKVIG